MKECLKCKRLKPLSLFGKHKITKDGFNYNCKKCCKEEAILFGRTKEGLISRIYTTQKAKSKKRGHKPPNYALNELKSWILQQDKFNDLYKNWVLSGYNSNLKPSCDRLNENIGYTLNNIRLVTWIENKKEHYNQSKTAKRTIRHKSVIGKCIDSGKEISFKSIRIAQRELNIGHISQCCSGQRKSSGGYVWRYE